MRGDISGGDMSRMQRKGPRRLPPMPRSLSSEIRASKEWEQEKSGDGHRHSCHQRRNYKDRTQCVDCRLLPLFVGSRSGLLESRHVVSLLGAQSWHCSRMNSPADQRATLVRLDGRELPMISMRLLWRGVGHRDGIQS
jgi:hypothetical protein